MNPVAAIVLVTFGVLFCFDFVVAEHSFLPAPPPSSMKKHPRASLKLRAGKKFTPYDPANPGPVVMGMGMTVRQEDKEKPICEQFVLSYADVRKAVFLLRRRLAPSEEQYKRCEACWSCFDCDEKRQSALLKEADVCVKRHGFPACALAVSLLGRDSEVSYTCRFYFKESRVGNCYALEYLTLNGLTPGGKLILYRETGKYGDDRFQCRAGERAKLPDLKNQNSCREKFHVSVDQIHAVVACALPAYTLASTTYTSCLATASDQFAITRCLIAYNYNVNAAFINCIVPHGVPAVAVTSLAYGHNALDCPVLRRDSYVGTCKAPDFVNLAEIGEVELEVDHLNVLLPGACNYE